MLGNYRYVSLLSVNNQIRPGEQKAGKGWKIPLRHITTEKRLQAILAYCCGMRADEADLLND